MSKLCMINVYGALRLQFYPVCNTELEKSHCQILSRESELNKVDYDGPEPLTWILCSNEHSALIVFTATWIL